ncbi:MAG: tripartite tricarboxylate transporter substrate binding protein [Burkholderiaceae bacterium]|nr:tripartite tricarboxylate transporter substrate binding protein [Burkholderiaceae bacterium]
MKIATLVSILALCAGSAMAQTASYPDKPIKIIVPVAAGGFLDASVRVLGERLTRSMGQPVVVENRAGASGITAATAVARAAPDGYTLLVGTIGVLAVNPGLFANLPYNTLKDFAPVSLTAATPSMLVVHPSVPVRTVRELIAYAKANPGKLNFASPGNGTTPHLAGELFKTLAQVEATHVPYKGSAPALTDLLAGRVEMMFDNVVASLQHVRQGRLRVLAVTSPKRSELLPDVPTMAEAGLPDQEIMGWTGILAPAGTPKEIVDKLAGEFTRAVRSADVQARFEGMNFVGGTPEEFDALIRSELTKWTQVVKDARIKAD